MLFDAWQRLHDADGRPPKLSDIDLMEFYQIASRIVILDRVTDEDGKTRFRWRYAGTRLAWSAGAEITGRFLDEVVEKETADEAAQIYEDAIRTGTHHIWAHPTRVVTAERSHVNYTRIILPLRGDTPDQAHLIGVYVFEIQESNQFEAKQESTEHLVR